MAAVALFMVGRLAKFNDIFTSTVPTINNFSNHALRINCLTLFVQLKIQNNILFLYTTPNHRLSRRCLQYVMQKIRNFVGLCVVWTFPYFCIATPPPPEIEELSPKNAIDLGFRIEIEKKDGVIEIDVEYPEKVGKWDIPNSPRIKVYDEEGSLVMETYAVFRVMVDGPQRPLRFGFSCDANYNVSITFWYKGNTFGDASKGFRIRSIKEYIGHTGA